MELERRGNEVEVFTSGVRKFTLLLSPSQFNLDEIIRVRANGRVVFEGRVPKKIETLMNWALIDRDRTMLYLSELTIDLAGSD